jgi:hypothetical protein
MTSATLYREGPDLDALLAELDAEYPGAIRVVDIVHARDGGVFGFFARPVVGVHYELSEFSTEPAEPAAQWSPGRPQRPLDQQEETGADPLAELIAAAETADRGGDDLQGPNAEFARMLLELAAQKAAERTSPDEHATAAFEQVQLGGTWTPSAGPRQAPPAPPAALPDPPRSAPADVPDVSQAPPAPPTSSAPVPPATSPLTDLELRRALTEIGVPVAWVPPHVAHKYAAIDELVSQLPAAPLLPTQPGAIIVLAGPARALRASAEQVRSQLRLHPEDVWTAGTDDATSITDQWTASVAASAHRMTGPRPVVVAVPTDEHDLDWAREVVAALQPDALWLHVEGTCKPADTRALIASFPRVDALVADGAARTTSPASLWEPQLPIALVDGAVPTRSSWAALLLERLAGLGV